MKTKQNIIKNIWGDVLFKYNNDLNYANLNYADLNYADLRDANLRDANLRDANLRGADLTNADLRGVDLRGVDLTNAKLKHANLRGADLNYADLNYADLRDADLRGVDLRGVDLNYADLTNADLRDANLRDANLRDANLRGADLDLNSLWFNKTRILPEGDIIGYKKCRNSVIVKLLIPKEAKRSHSFGRKCRCEFAKVIEIYGAKVAISKHDEKFIYKVGKIVKPSSPFSEDFLSECESGIHFFITKVEAENY